MLEGADGGFRSPKVLQVLEVPEVMRCVLPCMLEVLDVFEVLERLEVPDATRCVLLCMLEAVEGGPWFAGGAADDSMCALCTLEAVEGRLCLLEELEVPEVTRCVLLCMLEAVEGGFCLAGGGGGDALYAAVFAGGCGS